jgi:1-acyl-sn-glycerol-3-phosphate acyltransferase
MPSLRAGLVLAVFLTVTFILIPVQWLNLKLGLKSRRTFPNSYHRWVAKLFGIHIRIIGKPARERGVLLLANHTGWLDIVIFSAVMPLSFIAKSEVNDWPFFGTLARLQRTVFVARAKKSQTGQVRDEIRDRLLAGDVLVLFPEGTSSDGNAVLPFKSALVGAAQAGLDSAADVVVQPVSTAYTGIHGIPMGRENRPLFAWYGEMELVPHLWEALKAGPLDVVVEFHPALDLQGMDRKELTRRAENLVRAGHVRALRGAST